MTDRNWRARMLQAPGLRRRSISLEPNFSNRATASPPASPRPASVPRACNTEGDAMACQCGYVSGRAGVDGITSGYVQSAYLPAIRGRAHVRLLAKRLSCRARSIVQMRLLPWLL